MDQRRVDGTSIETEIAPLRDLCQTCPACAGKAVLRMSDQNQRIGSEIDRFNLRMIKRASQANLCLSLENHLEYLFRVGLPRTEVNHDLWVCLAKAIDDVRQEVCADGELGSDLKCTPPRGLKFLDGLPGERSRAQELFSMRFQHSTRHRQGERAPSTGEELNSE